MSSTQRMGLQKIDPTAHREELDWPREREEGCGGPGRARTPKTREEKPRAAGSRHHAKPHRGRAGFLLLLVVISCFSAHPAHPLPSGSQDPLRLIRAPPETIAKKCSL
ncbi:uncharacterized protein LOC115286558 isoform X6 [Suricata suricatta]|uniref:uncharacterized protein LOC115286558 isoform X6 n=1 Tax=Suricata suricatta TaxID=37032 RepID=UPI001155295D|nr:uncharacterized protein LOC115286558 isoform X6 [Suricata suricatta]